MYCLISHTNKLKKVKMKLGECKKLLRVSLRNLGAGRAEVYISILEDEKKYLSYFSGDTGFQYQGCLLRLR